MALAFAGVWGEESECVFITAVPIIKLFAGGFITSVSQFLQCAGKCVLRGPIRRDPAHSSAWQRQARASELIARGDGYTCVAASRSQAPGQWQICGTPRNREDHDTSLLRFGLWSQVFPGGVGIRKAESKRRVRVTVRSSQFVVRGKVHCFRRCIHSEASQNPMAFSRF